MEPSSVWRRRSLGICNTRRPEPVSRIHSLVVALPGACSRPLVRTGTDLHDRLGFDEPLHGIYEDAPQRVRIRALELLSSGAFDIHTIGWILMGAGALGIILSTLFGSSRGGPGRLTQRRDVCRSCWRHAHNDQPALAASVWQPPPAPGRWLEESPTTLSNHRSRDFNPTLT